MCLGHVHGHVSFTLLHLLQAEVLSWNHSLCKVHISAKPRTQQLS